MAKRKVLTAQLPPTPCTPEMRSRVVELAESEGRSIAEIQRDAISLFLQRYDRKSHKRDTKTINPSEPVKEN